ncbi:MAG TPA: MarR family winged helix-turn-helix transcriptional regulator [Acidimicrobiia bacterium]|jgi:DNA-binding MarR family transcriptional regulator|nr:MarR family winged helix-turn-helix transcriptional regulator [Acidimicrobiia bacterium]
MLPADDVGAELVAGSLAMLTRQASLMRLHELVSNRGGLTLERSAYPLLNQILALQGGRLSDVAAGLKVAVPTVSRQVRQLEELGLVARTQDPIDGRAILLEVTPAGIDALQRMRTEWCTTVAEILESWPAKDREILGELLERFALELLALRA